MRRATFVLGGHQTDFARHMGREGKTLFELMGDGLDGALESTGLEAREIETVHIGNFAGEMFSHQAHLGGLVASLRPELEGLPTTRHEAACAAGGAAIVAAMADLEAGRYDLACVLGVELMRNVRGEEAAANVGAAAWWGRETEGARYVWPHLFARLADFYEERFGLQREHLAEIARINFANARKNPRAQTRGWTMTDAHFAANDEVNPLVEGTLRRHDCSQITDGCAVLFLASETFAARWAQRRGTSLEDVPVIRGWGHRTGPMSLDEKLRQYDAGRSPWTLPHVRAAIEDTWRRAGISGIDAVDAVELHDCFSITEYVELEHLGLAPVGRGFEALDRIRMGGKTPVNPSGGLMGGGHPIGASGVRMVLDASRQVTGQAEACQVPRARTVQTLNIGGSGTTAISFIVTR